MPEKYVMGDRQAKQRSELNDVLVVYFFAPSRRRCCFNALPKHGYGDANKMVAEVIGFKKSN